MNPSITITIIPNDRGNPPGKLADAELHFHDSILAGLKLIGFAIWERRDGGRNVTFPARSYSVNGDRRSFSLLRPTSDPSQQDGIRDAILDAYQQYQQSLDQAGARGSSTAWTAPAAMKAAPQAPDTTRWEF